MDKLNTIKEKIHISNPDITDELLDLICKYVILKLSKELNSLNVTRNEQ